MAIKKARRRAHKKAEADKVTAQLAPLEEKAAKTANGNSNNGGAIIVDTAALKLPKNFASEDKDGPRRFRPDPAVVLIFFVSLAFIAFIAYLISQG